VTCQYCGQPGKGGHFQVAGSVSVADECTGPQIGDQPHLTLEWVKASARCEKAEIPACVCFAIKTATAQDQLRAACAARVPVAVMPADARHGNDTAFRLGIVELGLTYAAGIQRSPTASQPGMRLTGSASASQPHQSMYQFECAGA